jgi:hypothetical protein
VFVHVALLQRVADSMQCIHDTAHAATAEPAPTATTGEQQHAEEEASATCAIFYSINR